MSTQFYSLNVSKVTQEITDTVSLSFSIPSDLQDTFQYKQGQYLTLKFTIGGNEVRRAYSMSSSPVDKEITVTVKRVEKGLVSNHINDHVKEGTTVEVMPPQGRFFTELEEGQKKTYYLFGAGSGITPLMSILKTVIEQEPKSTVFLLYGNRNENSIIFKDQLDKLQSRYSGQLFVEHILSQPLKEKVGGLGGFFKKDKINWEGKVGRITKEIAYDFLDTNPAKSHETEYFICGPNDMIDTVENALLGRGLNKKTVHAERFTSATLPHENETATSASTPTKQDGAVLKVHLDGKIIETTVPADKTILDVMLDGKHDAPYSCTSGSCSTCLAKVIKGSVTMDVCFALDDDEIEEGYILTCQSHPTSDEVEITYDV